RGRRICRHGLSGLAATGIGALLGLLLGARNRLAREVHDVLAHTLSALSVQLTAVDSLVEDGAGAGDVRATVGRSRRLVVEGLEEIRRAVRALRDEPVALDDQLAALAEGTGAALRIRDLARPLPPTADDSWRLAQEALSTSCWAGVSLCVA
ncbi:histidine kinase, partial [Streptomyces caniscabiei]